MSRKWRLLITTDPERKEAIHSLDFGVVKEGTKRTMTLYMTNLEDYPVSRVKTEIKIPEVTVVAPPSLGVMETAELKISWNVEMDTLALKDVVQFSARVLKEVK